MCTVITFGTYDLLHVGHVNVLKNAKAMGAKLVVGVSSDDLNYSKKGVYPTYSQVDRMQIVASVKYVDKVFLETDLNLKRKYIIDHGATCLVMGDDWTGKFDHLKDVCTVVYLPRTEGVSSTSVKAAIYNSVTASRVDDDEYHDACE